MRIPKYVQDMMSRCRYDFFREVRNPDYAVGYTVCIRKRTPYTKVDTLRAECERLAAWADKTAGCKCVYILDVPEKTHYCNQSAVVTIFDPIMKQLEQYIPKEGK